MEDLRTEPRQERSRRTIDAILDAAETLIVQRGQPSFTAHELATAAGTSVGRVYYWFPDIPTVVTSLGERGSQRLAEHFTAMFDTPAELSRDASVSELVDCIVDFFVANPALVVLMLTGGATEDYGQAIRLALQDLSAGLFAARAPHRSEDERRMLGRVATALFAASVREFALDGDLGPLRRELVTMIDSLMKAGDDPHRGGSRTW